MTPTEHPFATGELAAVVDAAPGGSWIGLHRRQPPRTVLSRRSELAWFLFCALMLFLVASSTGELLAEPAGSGPAPAGAPGVLAPPGSGALDSQTAALRARATATRSAGPSASTSASASTRGTPVGPPPVSKPPTSVPTSGGGGVTVNASGTPECGASSWNVAVSATVVGGTATEASVYARRDDLGGSWQFGRMSGGPKTFNGSTYTEPSFNAIAWYVSVKLSDGRMLSSAVTVTGGC
ncbi:hypothetical protein Lfu02_50730 [Longispora fulva]|uniref:Uncharacterized protein n=1 Tax=Longispora fulva TaxID=619741 RepID=A0A8J7GXN2_9ACTN|nr:hypothetical protein [Longispora fulva]MBG6141029.1 hypothetical protein [Longispora fulva]GIG60701.1 hypothetical protein Lfu02_50730 [Longispora fulva]